MPALLACGWIGMLTNVQAMAQYAAHAPTAQVATQPGSPVPQEGIAAAKAPQPEGGTPNSAATLMSEDSLLTDNGLWDGAEVGPCCAICGGGSGCPPDWYTEQGVRFLGRTKPREIGMGYDDFTLVNSQTGTVTFDDPQVLNNRTAGPNFSPGYSMTIGHYFARDTLNRDNFVEFTFWGLNGFRDEASESGHKRDVLPASQLNTPFIGLVSGSLLSSYAFDASRNRTTATFVFGFDGADVYQTFYSSYNQDFELNGRISPRSRNDRLVMQPDGRWRRECQPGMYISYLYGIRFMQIGETFRFHSVGQYDLGGSSATLAGDYDVVAHNNLLGLQFGADMTFRQCRWSWGIRTKAGPYVNFADQASNINAGPVFQGKQEILPNPLDNRRLAYSRHVASLIGEVGFTASYKFRPNWMGRASYDFMWVTGLALAPEQLQFTINPVNRLNTNGTIFYHGPSLSLEWMW